MKEYQVQIGSDEYGWVSYGGESITKESIDDTERRAWQKVQDDKSNGVRLLPGVTVDAKALQARLDALGAATVRVAEREVSEWKPSKVHA